MKKVIVAFVAGALLMASTQVMADSISRIGKKVGGEAEVYLNGDQLSDAIIVDDKSYAPVRDIAEAFGAEVGFEGATKETKAIIDLKIEAEGGATLPDPTTTPEPFSKPVGELDAGQVKAELIALKGYVRLYTQGIETGLFEGEEKVEKEELIASYNQRLSELEARKAELEAQ